MNYYNDNDPFAVKWLRELIKDGLIPEGDIDDRSITDVRPSDLAGYVQCHFFAGIGGWSYALRLAGWEDDRPCWTGSCPCQPFSVAGKGEGLNDPRHLWPAFRWLIAQCKPSTVFGEQVASKDGRSWLAGVRADLERMGYRVGAADLCAAGIGAPHIRQRLWWVADNQDDGRGERNENGRGGISRENAEEERVRPSVCCNDDLPAYTPSNGSKAKVPGQEQGEEGITGEFYNGCHQVDWFNAIWWPCRDGKYRRVPARWMEDAGKWEIEPAFFPLVNAIPNRVGILRGAGNAIVPALAAEFIQAILQIEEANR